MLNKIKLVSLSLLFTTGGVSAQEHPNIVLINIDDLGWSDLGFVGSTFYETPNIDSLRRRGMYFPNAYACAANSAPSRACLISGEYSPRHGIYTVDPPARGKSRDRRLIPCPNEILLRDDVLTLPLILNQNGYETCMVGKWHLGEDPTKQGFEQNFGGYTAGHPKSYFSPYKNPALKDGPDGEYLTDRLGDEATNFIRSRDRDRSFFLYYAPYEVHTPLRAQDDTVEKYRHKQPSAYHFNPTYAAMIEAMDRNVGKVLEALRHEGIERETIVIFTSDNGGVYDISRQWPLRAGKGSFYEGGIRVPFIVSWESKIEKNVTNQSVISQIDLYPTLISLAGINTPTDKILDGLDILDIFLSKDKSADTENRALYWHFPAYLEGGNEQTKDRTFRSRPVSVIRKGKWKLIINLENSETELYDLATDRSEKKNLSTEHPRKVKELSRELKTWKSLTKACDPTTLNPQYVEPDE